MYCMGFKHFLLKKSEEPPRMSDSACLGTRLLPEG
jgi:hypothetical protein